MDFDDPQRRAQDEQHVRRQRDAAEKKIPTERLRRRLREAFAREDARKLREERGIDAGADPLRPTDTER